MAPAVDWGDTYTTDRFVTSAVDASILPSETLWYYRVMAYDVEQSGDRRHAGARRAPARADRSRDASRSAPGPDGVTRLSWRSYAGERALLQRLPHPGRQRRRALDTLTIVSDQATDSLETDALHSGTTYQLRVQAVRTTTLGGFVLGETNTVTFTVP